jgi:hypothetical protein
MNLNKLCNNMGHYIHMVRILKPNEYNINRLKTIDFMLKDYYNNNCNDWKKYAKNETNFKEMNCVGYHKENLKFNYDDLHVYLTCSIISWSPRVKTLFHYHPNLSCIMMPIHNGLQQDILKNDISNSLLLPNEKEIYKSCDMVKGECYYIDDEIGKHRIINNTDKFITSINIYESLYPIDIHNDLNIKKYYN